MHVTKAVPRWHSKSEEQACVVPELKSSSRSRPRLALSKRESKNGAYKTLAKADVVRQNAPLPWPLASGAKSLARPIISTPACRNLKADRKSLFTISRGESGAGAVDMLPAGYKVSENEKTGLLLLKRG